MSGIEEHFGLEGYARYFKLLEVMALNMERGSQAKLSLSWSKWQTTLKGKRNKLRCFLKHLAKQREINLHQAGEILEIEFPNLNKLKDEWQLRLGSNSGATRKVEVEEEEDREEEKNTPPTPPGGKAPKRQEPFKYSPEFEQVWQAYPRKVGKGAAYKAFQKAHINGNLPTLLKSIEDHKADWNDPQFTPHLATYLNQRRWEDEIGSSSEPKRVDIFSAEVRSKFH